MTRALPRLALVAVLTGWGCTANFFVGEMETETDGPADDTTGAASSAESVSASSEPTSPSGSGGGTTTSTTTVGEVASVTEATEPTSTTLVSESETTPMTESSSSSAEGPTTTGPTGCADLDYEMCMMEDGCAWVGEIETGECLEDPCFETDCDGLGADDCEMAEMCLWLGDVTGQCFLNECFPCNETDNPDLCMAAVNCMYNELEGTCGPVD